MKHWHSYLLHQLKNQTVIVVFRYMSSAFYDALLIATQSAVEDSWLKTEVRCWDFSAMRLVSFPSCVFAQCMSWNMWKLSVWCWERLFQAVRPHGYYFKLSDRMMIISSCPTA